MDDINIGISAASSEFPLTVWLRGDEPFFEDFSLQAEQVMETLGIKRSRLRQISGSELRVGRKRIDRYIRPVYRPEDVNEYRAWTRSTASHQKSSAVLEGAAKNLADNSHTLMTQVATDCKQLLLAVEDKVNLYSQPLLRQQEDASQILKRTLHQLTRQSQEQIQAQLQLLLKPLIEGFSSHKVEISIGIESIRSEVSALSECKALLLEAYSLQKNIQKSTQLDLQQTQTLLVLLQQKVEAIQQSLEAVATHNIRLHEKLFAHEAMPTFRPSQARHRTSQGKPKPANPTQGSSRASAKKATPSRASNGSIRWRQNR